MARLRSFALLCVSLAACSGDDPPRAGSTVGAGGSTSPAGSGGGRPAGSGGAAPSATTSDTGSGAGGEASTSTAAETSSSSGSGGLGPCPDPPGVEIVATGQSPKDLAVDDTHVYFTDGSPFRVPKAGGVAEALAQEEARWVQVDDTHVYWTSKDGVRRVAKSGGTPETVGPGGTQALAGDSFFWTVFDFTEGGAYAVPKTGGDAVTIASKQVAPLVVAADGAYAYWNTQGADQRVWRAPVAGGGSPESVAPVGGVGGIGIDATHVYWSGTNFGRRSLAGGDPEVLIPDLSDSGDLVVDEASVYFFMDDGGSRLVRYTKSDGAFATLACLGWHSRLRVDATHAYWTTGYNGQYVYRVPK